MPLKFSKKFMLLLEILGKLITEKNVYIVTKLFTLVFSGIASEALGLQCSFSYNKQHPYITPRYALHEKQNIGVDVNKLLQVLQM